jgi:hypothetical protein
LGTPSRYKHSAIHYIYLEIDFHLFYTHAVNSSKSQNQTYMTLRMDDRTGKHLAKGLRTNAQRTTANIPAGVENLLLPFVFLLLSTTKE